MTGYQCPICEKSKKKKYKLMLEIIKRTAKMEEQDTELAADAVMLLRELGEINEY